MPPRTSQLKNRDPLKNARISTRPSTGKKSPDKRASTSRRVRRIHRDGYGECALLTGIVKREEEVEWEEEEKNRSDEEEDDSEYKPNR